jgi:hypothetical protein
MRRGEGEYVRSRVLREEIRPSRGQRVSLWLWLDTGAVSVFEAETPEDNGCARGIGVARSAGSRCLRPVARRRQHRAIPRRGPGGLHVSLTC